MYRIGHAIIGRGGDSYEDITDHSALRELNLFLLGLAAANLLFFLYMRLYKGLNEGGILSDSQRQDALDRRKNRDRDRALLWEKGGENASELCVRKRGFRHDLYERIFSFSVPDAQRSSGEST